MTEDEVKEVLSADYGEIEAMEDVYVPDELLSDEEIETLIAERKPSIVESTIDAATGVHQRVLSNGVRVNYRVTNNEPGSGFLRLVIPGGRTAEPVAAELDRGMTVLPPSQKISRELPPDFFSLTKEEVGCVVKIR